MVKDSTQDSADDERGVINWSRRNLLKLTGGGAGLAVLAGMGGPSAGQNITPTPTNGDQTDGTATNEHFLADLVDPVFGNPLTIGETDDLELENVVKVMF